MMTSLAVGEYGAGLVLRQFAEMARSPALEVLTWRKLFAAVVEYCVRWAFVRFFGFFGFWFMLWVLFRAFGGFFVRCSWDLFASCCV